MRSLFDVLSNTPNYYIFYKSSLGFVNHGDKVIIAIKVLKHLIINGGIKIYCYSEDIYFNILFFNVRVHYIKLLLPIGVNKFIKGRVQLNNNDIIITNPFILDNIENINYIEPVYCLRNGQSQESVKKDISIMINNIPQINEWIGNELINYQEWFSWKDSICRLHNPTNKNDTKINGQARRRLAYDELMAYKFIFCCIYNNNDCGSSLNFTGNLCIKFTENLTFKLTKDQTEAINVISEDQRKGKRMIRLLQGDVGSGKTIVAIAAMLNAVESGMQAVLMVPTVALAKQHFKYCEDMLADFNIEIFCICGKMPTKEKNKILGNILNKSANIIIGTHALFQENVVFNNLGIVIIDEQQRFGANQKMSLISKSNKNVDTLLMSATPIPRTLMLILYGNIDCSYLRSKPQDRKEIITKMICKERIEEVINSISSVIKSSSIYWICPFVKKAKDFDIASVEERFEFLSKKFGSVVGMVHGLMSDKSIDLAINNFKSGVIKLLVATSIVEVGIDICDASVIIIENPECFGLSQLHQLRGRVGRSGKQSFCVLFYDKKKESFNKLQVVKNSTDGFYIAEKDLSFRGSGKMFGNEQSGHGQFKFFDISAHQDLMEMVQNNSFCAIGDFNNHQKYFIKQLFGIINFDEYVCGYI